MSTTTTETVVFNDDLDDTIVIDDATWMEWIFDGRRQNRHISHRWNSDTIHLAIERVNRGAQLLDRQNPSWMDRVFPQRLQMSSGRWCIIGQTYGDYDSVGIPFGMDSLDTDVADEVQDKAVEHGFMENGVPFELLDRVWVYLLNARAVHSDTAVLSAP